VRFMARFPLMLIGFKLVESDWPRLRLEPNTGRETPCDSRGKNFEDYGPPW
jgi:hypothetical protein